MIKNISLLLVVCFFFVKCGTSDSETIQDDSVDDGSPQQTDDFVFTIFNQDVFGAGLSAIIYLTNESGQILAQEDFVPNQETTLVSVGTQGMRHDLVLFFDFVGIDGKRRNTVYILEEIVEGSYQYSGFEVEGFDSNNLQLSLYNIDKRPFYITSQDRVLFSPYTSSNGGTIDLSPSNGVQSNLGGVYLAMRRNVDDFQRYYWDETPPISDHEELDYNELPLLDNILSLSAPAGFGIGSIKIFGHRPNNQSDVGHQIFRFGGSGFNVSDSYGLPNGLFNRYSIETLYGKGNTTHRLVKASNSPFMALPTQTLSLNVTNNSFQAFSATTTGDYDSFFSVYEYEDIGANTFYQVRIYGRKSPEVTYNHRFLINSLFGNGFNIDNLEHQTIFLRNYDGVNGYNDFVEKFLFHAPLDIPRRSNFESVFNFY